MSLQAPMRCSALAEQLDEPMIGSVDHRVRWLLVEDRGAWGRDAARDVLGFDLTAAAKDRRMRVVLVRRREGDPAADVVRRVILVDTASAEMSVRAVEDLSGLSLDATVADFGVPMTDPIFLVCTNGKRDACCAVRGRVLMAALAPDHAERVWETTHLGGHRFGANLVCLPDGIVYGRVSPADGPRLADAYLDGLLDPAQLRGRSAWPPPAQVAEQALRLARGIDGIDDVWLVAADVRGDAAEVSLATPDGVTHRFELARERLAPRPVSCRADELEEPLHWRLRE